jgi:TetR/AcrR family transcriptional regulator of autoinduction and epiphytic fitness
MPSATRSRSDIKREAIINAATQAFQEFGVNGTTMDKLAELANVSKRTVYNHFSTKEDLVMYLIKAQWQNALLNVNVVFDEHSPLFEQLEVMLLADIEFMSGESHLELARVAIGHFFYEPEKLKDEVQQLKAQESSMHKWLNSAKKSARIDCDNVQHVVDEIDSLVKGQCFWPQLFKIEPPLSRAEKKRIAGGIARLILCRYEAQSKQS